MTVIQEVKNKFEKEFFSVERNSKQEKSEAKVINVFQAFLGSASILFAIGSLVGTVYLGIHFNEACPIGLTVFQSLMVGTAFLTAGFGVGLGVGGAIGGVPYWLAKRTVTFNEEKFCNQNNWKDTWTANKWIDTYQRSNKIFFQVKLLLQPSKVQEIGNAYFGKEASN